MELWRLVTEDEYDEVERSEKLLLVMKRFGVDTTPENRIMVM